MVSPWISQTLARPILWTAVKYISKIVTRSKIETEVQHFSAHCSYVLKIWATTTGQAMAWLVPMALDHKFYLLGDLPKSVTDTDTLFIWATLNTDTSDKHSLFLLAVTYWKVMVAVIDCPHCHEWALMVLNSML